MKFIYFLSLVVSLSFLSCNSGNDVTYAEIETEFGTMKVELYNSTPIHKENFIKLAKEGFYDDLLFHRIIQGFMVQGGDPNSRDAKPGQRLGSGGPGYTLEAEIGAPHFKGTLAAARQGDAMNPEKRSSGSQFYIIHGGLQTDQNLSSAENRKGIKYNEAQVKRYKEQGGYPILDMDYTVFGEVTVGLDIVDKLAAVAKDQSDRPLEDVKMKVTIL